MEKPRQFRFTINDYERILEKGILSPSQRVEFIRGELFCILPTSELHGMCIIRLHNQFSHRVSAAAKIIGDVPIRLADSAPRPDLAILTCGSENSDSKMPSPDEVLLVIEVADETLEYDREVKGAIYAENGIPEYWIVNLIDRCLEVYGNPQPDGSYGDVYVLKAGDTVSLLRLSTETVQIDELFL